MACRFSRQLRRAGSRTPVLLLTAKDTVADGATRLDLGADDYLIKPFALEELLARVRALLRRKYDAAAYTIVSGVALLMLVVFWQESAHTLATPEGILRRLLRAVYFLSIAGFA